MLDTMALKCPSCGAPLTVHGDEAEVTCQYCGTSVAVPEALRQPGTVSKPRVIAATVDLGPAPATSAVASSRGCLAPVIIALAISLVVAIPVLIATGINPLNLANPDLGHLVTTFGGKGSQQGKFTSPHALAVDRANKVYVADASNSSVQQFDENGQFLSSWRVPTDSIGAIAADRHTFVYVVAGGAFGGQIFKYLALASSPFAVIGTQGQSHVLDVGVLPDDSLVAFSNFDGNDDLVFLTRDGRETHREQHAVSNETGEDNIFANGVHMAVDGSGNIYVLYPSISIPRVLKYRSTGVLAKTFGSEGRAESDFDTPVGAIGVDAQGRVYVSDARGIARFDDSGHYEGRIHPPKPGLITGIGITWDNKLFALNSVTGEVYRFDLDK